MIDLHCQKYSSICRGTVKICATANVTRFNQTTFKSGKLFKPDVHSQKKEWQSTFVTFAFISFEKFWQI